MGCRFTASFAPVQDLNAQMRGTQEAFSPGFGQVVEVEQYVLPPATDARLGGVIVGGDLEITQSGVLSVVKAQAAEQDNSHPITSAAVYAEIGNINALLETI